MSGSFLKDIIIYPTGLVIFGFADKNYCIDINNVITILNPDENNSSNYPIDREKKIVKYRGDEIPLFDASVIFNAECISGFNDQRVIIILFAGHKFAFLIDHIIEIISLNEKIFNSIIYKEIHNDLYLSGYIEYEGRIIYIPDLNEIIKLEDTFK